jgi:hypothetical protein
MLEVLSQSHISLESLRLATAILTSEPMASPSSAALSFLNKVFGTLSSSTQATDMHLLFTFTHNLADLQYTQFTSMVRPVLLKNFGRYTEFGDVGVVQESLDLLGYLLQQVLVDGVKDKIGDLSKCIDILAQSGDAEAQAISLACLCKTGKLLPKEKFNTYLLEQIGTTLALCEEAKFHPEEEYRETWYNSGWRIATALRSLGSGAAIAEEQVERIVEQWGWNSFVMDGLKSYIQNRKS